MQYYLYNNTLDCILSIEMQKKCHRIKIFRRETLFFNSILPTSGGKVKNSMNHRLNALGFASGIDLPVILSIFYYHK